MSSKRAFTDQLRRFEKFNYATNAAGEITEWTTQKGAAAGEKYALDYDAASQLKTGLQTNASTGVTLHQNYYDYDKAGNRTSVQLDNAVTKFTANALNQLTGSAGGGTLRVKGTLNEAGKVTINGQAAWMSNGGLAFEGSVPVTPGSNVIGISAVDAGSHASTKNYTVTVPPGGTKSYTYDHAGNMTGDGSRTFVWDALNQLVKITSAGGASSEFTYDALGRRVKIVEKNAGGTVTETRHFVWDGMEMAERRDAAGTLVRRYYPDGYVDGVAAEPDVSEQLLSLRDHLGSVRATVYEEDAYSLYQDYDLYGGGSVSDLTDFGYTGHYYHAASGLTLAPFRAYDANLGRWISRDPIQEKGGINLYSYVFNNPIKLWDLLGLAVGDWWDLPSNYNRAQEIGNEEGRKHAGESNNLGDAQRHSEWSRRTTCETNAFTAWSAGIAHEFDNMILQGQLFRGNFSETMMDLRNNEVGRLAGMNGKPINPADLQKAPTGPLGPNTYGSPGERPCY